MTAEQPDNVYTLVGLFLTFSTVVGGQVVGYLRDQANRAFQARTDIAIKQTASIVPQVQATVIKVAALQHVTDATHTLVNSAYSAQLKVSAVALRRISHLTVNLPGHQDDVDAADLAEQLLADHEAKQHIVDTGDKIVP